MLLWVEVSSFTRNITEGVLSKYLFFKVDRWVYGQNISKTPVKKFIILIACNFTTNEYLRRYFSRIMALSSQNTFWGLILVFKLVSYSPRIIFKGFVKTQKAADVNGIINLISLEVFHGTLWQCFLACKFSFLNCWKIYLLRPRYPKDQNF